jgi:hypothetical protein
MAEQTDPPEEQPKKMKREHVGPPAMPSEIIEQLNALCTNAAESTRLVAFAKNESRKFHGRVDESIAHDLFVEAIRRAVSGGKPVGPDDDPPARRWYPQEINFPIFFRQSIRSISHNWRKKGKKFLPPREQIGQAEHPDAGIVEFASPVDEEAQLEMSIMLSKARESICGRPEAARIFDMIVEGYTRTEICERLTMSEQDYDTVFRWMKRTWKDEGYRL